MKKKQQQTKTKQKQKSIVSEKLTNPKLSPMYSLPLEFEL